MAKKSKQRPVRKKKDESGCMRGLISMFDFRHGRTTRRLLSDNRRYPTNNIHGFSYATPEADLSTNYPEMHASIEEGENIQKSTSDLVRTRVKEFIEEEIFLDQDLKSIIKDREETIRTSKTLKESFDQETSVSNQVSAQKTTEYHDLESLVKEILFIYQKKNEQSGVLDTGAKRSFPIVEEKLVAAVEVLLNGKSTKGNHKKLHHSKEMFQMLRSNKEMFLKIIQDQNSILLNEDHKSKSKSMEPIDQESEESVTRKHRKFFQRSKSQESITMNGKDRIVILQPGSSESQLPVGNETHSEGNGSRFSFLEIKRRLKHAIGKEQPKIMGKSVIDGGWSSPNRDHFYTEKFTRVSSLRETELKNENINHKISNIYVEAKKHLSEMLTSGDEDAESMMRSLPKSLGRILSLREYNSLSPGTSPRAQMKPLVNISQPLTTSENLEGEVVVKTSEGVREDKTQSLDIDVFCEPSGSSNGVHDEVIFNGFNEDRASESLKPELHDENYSSSLACKPEELEVNSSDKTGNPSPVSVLDPLFSDDDITPARTVSRFIEPRCIQFDETVTEDQQIRITDSGDTEESVFEYVEAVLLSSDLNWAEFEKRWISLVQILDPSLFEEVEACSNRARYDQQFLFDSTNEVLEDVCDCFIPESSFIKRNVWPVPKGMDLINEVWSRLELCLCKAYPRDLEKLARNDLETSRMWMDVRCVSREIVVEIEGSIFKETIDDMLFEVFLDDGMKTVLSCS